MIRNTKKLMDLLFESNENPMITTDSDRFHLEDCIQYVTKPGVIVATIKGKSKYGIQQLPIGAIDNFRFMKITNEDAILEQEKNNGKSYQQIMDEYEGEKAKVLEQWKQNNQQAFDLLNHKYGNRIVGMDIIQNEKKFQPVKEDGEGENGEQSQQKKNDVNVCADNHNITKSEPVVSEGMFDLHIFKNQGIKAIIEAAKWNKKNKISDSEVKLYVNVENELYGGKYPVTFIGEPIEIKDKEMAIGASTGSNLTETVKNDILFIFGDANDKDAVTLEQLKMVIKDVFDKSRVSMYDGVIAAADPNSKTGDKVNKLSVKESEDKSNGNLVNASCMMISNDSKEAVKVEIKIDTSRKFIKAKPDNNNKELVFYFTGTDEQEKDSDAYANVLT